MQWQVRGRPTAYHIRVAWTDPARQRVCSNLARKIERRVKVRTWNSCAFLASLRWKSWPCFIFYLFLIGIQAMERDQYPIFLCYLTTGRGVCFKEITMETGDNWWITETTSVNSNWLQFSMEHLFTLWTAYGKTDLEHFFLNLSDWLGLPREDSLKRELQNRFKHFSPTFWYFFSHFFSF